MVAKWKDPLVALPFKETVGEDTKLFMVSEVFDSADKAKAEGSIKEMCEKLLVNPVIEKYEIISLEKSSS